MRALFTAFFKLARALVSSLSLRMLIARQMACLIPIKDQVNQARKSPKPLMLVGCYIYNRSLYFTRQLARAIGVLVRSSQGNQLLGELRSVVDMDLYQFTHSLEYLPKSESSPSLYCFIYASCNA
jgi:hypothetical protein